MARNTVGDENFIDIHVDTPLAIAEQRDVKGLYAKARAGQIKNFTGIDSAYKMPENAEIVVDTVTATPQDCVDPIISYLMKRGMQG